MKPTLFLMLGYPGAGKTTTAKIIHKLTGAEHLWADKVRREMYDRPTYSHTENMHLYTHLNDMVDELLAEGKSVVFDTNFNFYSDREHLRSIGAKHDAQTIVVWVQSDKDVAKKRATVDAHLHSHTRVLGNMSVEHFERITSNQEIPHQDETVVVIEGHKIDDSYVALRLKEVGIAVVVQ